MITAPTVPTLSPAIAQDGIAVLSREEFIARWHSIVGEPPAIMLECRAAMIRLLVEASPIAAPVEAFGALTAAFVPH